MKKRIMFIGLVVIVLLFAGLLFVNSNSEQYLTIKFVDNLQDWPKSGLVILSYGNSYETRVLPFIYGHVQFRVNPKEKVFGLNILSEGKLFSCWRIEFTKNPKLPNELKPGQEKLYVDVNKSCRVE